MPKHRRIRHSTTRRVASATVVGAAVTGAMISTSGTAAAADSPNDVQRFQPGTGHGKPQQVVTFKGRFIEDGKPLANQRVTLRANAPGNPWHVKRTVRTDENGLAKASSKVHATGQWKMVLAGDLDDDGKDELRVSPTRTVHVETPDAKKAKRVLQNAAKLAGTPYVYGGTTPAGFDCSGFTQYVYNKAGVNLPRTSDAQAGAVKRVSQAAKKPGDLLFFHEGGSVYHAAVYAGKGKMWTAPQSGETVKLDGIYSSSYFVGRAW